MRSIEPRNVSVTEMSRIAFKLRKVWLDVMKKGIRSYRLNALPELIGYIYRGNVQVTQGDGRNMGKPIFINTDDREKETGKHSFRYAFELLGAI